MDERFEVDSSEAYQSTQISRQPYSLEMNKTVAADEVVPGILLFW